MNPIGPPAPRPCESCPYARGVASGIWAGHEYDKLEPYDNDIAHQPQQVFVCHQTERDSPQVKVCAGWVGCHGADNLLALRVAPLVGQMTAHDVRTARAYVCSVPLFASGHEAAAHGRASIDAPDERARRAIQKITRTRSDLNA
ncbi:DUF6283 family protein [Catellatospora chokoriensis]|uniref:Uncharacterized protein n=1 Tax=Catellatospora chokoriensis TaxID=310353 RepID=A0A8J3K1B3_9ACTN|nr:DUF6283 family protein [Catellatospora chokoriensis]GIF94847.1 hypothetical protein Cch02nite_82910 [Catellatospora chokoriensis]